MIVKIQFLRRIVCSSTKNQDIHLLLCADARQPLQPRREQPAAKSEAETAAEKKRAEEDKKKAEEEKKKAEEERKRAAKAKEDETRVELVKDGSGFGFSIVGGTDTPLVSM